MALRILPLDNMAARHTGLTPEVAACYLQAAAVCLDEHHKSPVEFTLNDDSEEFDVQVNWSETDERTKSAWANKSDRIRDGAYACALATAEEAKGLVAIQRAETLTGADYYVAPIGSTSEDLEDWFRLEVSGTDLDKSKVKSRLKEKVDQTIAGESNLPALAVVVGFQVKLIMMKTVEN